MFPKLLVAIAGLILILATVRAGAQVRIAEFEARNNSGMVDVGGAHSDWIDLENTSAGAVNLAGWSLTNQAVVTLPPAGRLVVFASGKNRVNPAAELHTNFTLNGVGEYLALFQPGGLVVASQFAPAFPVQRDDFSYGFSRNVTEDRVVTPTSPGKWLVLSGNTLGTTWKDPGFIDAEWTPVLAGVGFQSGIVGPFPQAYWTFDDTTADSAGTTPVTNNGAVFSTAVAGANLLTNAKAASSGFVDALNANPLTDRLAKIGDNGGVRGEKHAQDTARNTSAIVTVLKETQRLIASWPVAEGSVF